MFTIEFYEKLIKNENGKVIKTEIPVKEFLDSLDDKMLGKCIGDIEKLSILGNQARPPLTKKIGDEVFELRTKQSNNIVRIFYFFCVGKRIILTNGFIKKTNKTPKSEIEKAEEYKKDFLDRL